MPYGTTSKYFSSDMPGAPAIFADPGGMVGWLDSVLVNGYGAAVISQIVVTDGVAVVTTTLGHSLRKWMVALHEGTGNPALDGEHRVIAAAGASYTFEVTGVPNGTYTGGSTKVAPLGFEISYSATNRRIYRSKDTVRRNAVSLYVDDTNTVSGWNIGANKSLAQVKMVCDVVALDSYTTLDTTWWPKSGAVSGTLGRPWLLAGDALGFYSTVDAAGNASYLASCHFMQINTWAVGDQFATVLEGAVPSTSQIASGGAFSLGAWLNMTAPSLFIRRIARGLGQTGVSYPICWFGLGVQTSSGLLSGGTDGSTISSTNFVGLAEFSPANAGSVLGRDVLVVHGTAAQTGGVSDATARGVLPGLRTVPSILSWNMTPSLRERHDGVLLALPAQSGNNSGRLGGYFVDITSGWRT